MKWTSWVALVTLLALGGFVVWSSLDGSGVRCEVCVAFDGSQACRAVDGPSEEEARRAAQTNACALLTSGVTRTLACERTPPLRSECRGEPR